MARDRGSDILESWDLQKIFNFQHTKSDFCFTLGDDAGDDPAEAVPIPYKANIVRGTKITESS